MNQKAVDLSRQRLTNIPFMIISPRVTWLILTDNKITTIPSDIKLLPNLERLSLSDNCINHISENLKELKNLSWLDLTRNSLRSMPTDLNFNRMVGLGLSENLFDEIPDWVYNCRNLRKLGFFSNHIKMISFKINNLVSLTKLDLSNNLLEHLPDEITQLKKLEWINLSNNRLKSLPRLFGNLTNLEELGLGNNELEYLPCIDNLRNLKVFSAFNNRLSNFNISSPSIRRIDLSGNKIRYLPANILQTIYLHNINLKNNLISKIDIKRRQKFYFGNIDLGDNFLEVVPYKFVLSVEHCYQLTLDGNRFKLAEDTISAPPRLKECCLNVLKGGNDLVWNQCDYCDRFFINTPHKVITPAMLDSGMVFYAEHELCSMKCFNQVSENKFANIARLNRM